MDPIHVLLVDDEERFLVTTSKLLGKKGYKVTMARNGIEALTVLSQQGFVNVAVLDVMMPGMNGLDALKFMKQRSPDTEVIMLTGHATIDSVADGLRAGAFDFMMKPVEIEDLVAKIDEASVRQHKKERRTKEVEPGNRLSQPPWIFSNPQGGQ